MTQDGDLGYSYDKNGNRTVITYDPSVSSATTYDIADRPLTLTLTRNPTDPPTPIVSGATYKAFGPLATLSLGNGLAETRGFDARYYPASITVPSRLAWTYESDASGNPTAITDSLDSSGSRTFAYEEWQSFLTQGSGPWGNLAWSYDRIGNRMTETRDGTVATYTYGTNGAGGHTPLLNTVVGADTWSYSYAASGDATQIGAGEYVYDEQRHLASSTSPSDVFFGYDGRGYLNLVTAGIRPQVELMPTYGSDGTLHHLLRSEGCSSYVLYLANRPVATYVIQTYLHGSGEELRFTTTDHLGTPVLETDAAGATLWAGGFEPFGASYNAPSTFLRLPGQWSDETFALYYNVSRWLDGSTGRYSQPDPLLSLFAAPYPNRTMLFGYAASNPLFYVDPFGLQERDPFRRPWDSGPWGQRPNPRCCDPYEIGKAIENADRQLGGMGAGVPPSGTPTSYETGAFWCDPTSGLCYPFPPTEPFNPPNWGSKDPCVLFCTRVHEWAHRVDDRSFSRNLLLEPDAFAIFREKRAYQVQGACLRSF